MIKNLLCALQRTMPTPEPWGTFHWLCLILTAAAVCFLYYIRKSHCENQLKIVLGTYAITAFALELLKQIVWSFDYDLFLNSTTWDYQWYSAPFQLCTTPIYVCLICMFLDRGERRTSLLSYIAFTTILGSISTVFIPDSCFVSMILVNVHTTWMHYGSLAVSLYLMFSGEVELTFLNLRRAIKVFIMFVCMATVLNIVVYNSGILNGETFNMFYISPYFISSLPIFDTIQQNVPYVCYLLVYIFALSLGSTIVFVVANLIKCINATNHSLFRRNHRLHFH